MPPLLAPSSLQSVFLFLSPSTVFSQRHFSFLLSVLRVDYAKIGVFNFFIEFSISKSPEKKLGSFLVPLFCHFSELGPTLPLLLSVRKITVKNFPLFSQSVDETD